MCCKLLSLVYLLQKQVFVCLHAHSVLILTADLIEKPVQRIIIAFSILHKTMPQYVHLLQTQP